LLAQQFQDRDTLYSDSPVNFVSAPSGLLLREGPDRSTRQLGTIPYAMDVVILEVKPGFIEIDNHHGQWKKVRYGNSTGWLFGGYLSNDVPPSSNIRHWNKNHSMYFLITSDVPGSPCGNAYNYDHPCHLSVYNSSWDLLRNYDSPTGVEGWLENEVVLSTFGADGGGGGFFASAWSPVTGQKHEIFSSFFENNPRIDSAQSYLVYGLCVNAVCHKVEYHSQQHQCNLVFQPDANTTQPVRTFSCQSEPRLTRRHQHIYLQIDKECFELDRNQINKVSNIPE